MLLNPNSGIATYSPDVGGFTSSGDVSDVDDVAIRAITWTPGISIQHYMSSASVPVAKENTRHLNLTLQLTGSTYI